jgi:hypothetical protein
MGPHEVTLRRNRGSALNTFARSPNIWHDCPYESIRNGEIAGYIQEIIPTNGGLITSPTTEAALVGLPLSGFGSSGSTITYAAIQGGALVLTEATDNESVGVRHDTHPFQISANKGKLWCEFRVKVSSITDNAMGFIFGLMDDVTMTVDIPLSSANPPIMATTVNFVGFRMPEEDAGLVQFSYDADDTGQTTDAEVVIANDIVQLAADTYVNLGFVFDPNDADRVNSSNPGAPTLSCFVNNIRNSTTKTIPDATGTDFPADALLGLMAFVKSGSGAAVGSIQWARAVQLGV